jgi:Asp-tRNA(Asn)/Glu-tRNA(Gln) amidotransferase A subunit family amidase
VTPPLPDAEPQPEVVAAARAAGQLLEDLGHSVEEIDAPFRSPEMFRAFTAVFGPMVCSQAMVGVMLAGGREPTADDIERLSMWLWETCRASTASPPTARSCRSRPPAARSCSGRTPTTSS